MKTAEELAKIKERLEYLRGELDAERISYGELHELQCLAEYIDKDDVQLLEAAGVPEFPEEPEDHTDDPCPCGDADCNRPNGHPVETP